MELEIEYNHVEETWLLDHIQLARLPKENELVVQDLMGVHLVLHKHLRLFQQSN